MTYPDGNSVTDTEEAGGPIALVADEVSNFEDEYDSQVSATHRSSSTALSASYHIRSSNEDFPSTPTRGSQSQLYSNTSTPLYSNSYHASSSDMLGATLSRSTLSPTYTGTTPHSRSHGSSAPRSRHIHTDSHLSVSPAPARRTAGELISFFEERAHSRTASAPVEATHARPASPMKPYSTSHSAPGLLPHARGDIASQRSGKTLSSWSFGTERSNGPSKTLSEPDSAVSGSTGYSRSGAGGYMSGLVGAIGGLVGFSSSSSSSRMSTTSSRSPPRRRHSPRRLERTASSPRSAFSQPRRSPKGKERERATSRGSLAPPQSPARSYVTEESLEEAPPEPQAVVPPPLDVAEYGGTGEVHSITSVCLGI